MCRVEKWRRYSCDFANFFDIAPTRTWSSSLLLQQSLKIGELFFTAFLKLNDMQLRE